jgi:hypothetical protein
MANRNFNRRQSLEKEVKDIYAKASIGVAGAPTLTSKIGVTSLVRNGAGDYTITFDDKYSSLKFFEVIHLASSAQDLSVQIHSELVASSKTVRFLCLTGATPTDPANGSSLLIKAELKNTSVI